MEIAQSLAPALASYQELLETNLGAGPRLVSSALGQYAGATGGVVASLQAFYRDMGVSEEALADLPLADVTSTMADSVN